MCKWVMKTLDLSEIRDKKYVIGELLSSMDAMLSYNLQIFVVLNDNEDEQHDYCRVKCKTSIVHP